MLAGITMVIMLGGAISHVGGVSAAKHVCLEFSFGSFPFCPCSQGSIAYAPSYPSRSHLVKLSCVQAGHMFNVTDVIGFSAANTYQAVWSRLQKERNQQWQLIVRAQTSLLTRVSGVAPLPRAFVAWAAWS